MDFRELEGKERLQVDVPPEINTAVRVKAAQDRQSIAEATTELLCKALGIDPRSYGIEPAATAAASA